MIRHVCVVERWDANQVASRGADDLLPIMTYVVVKARIPALYSEAMLMQDLMSEKAAMEIGGYSLATLQTSLSYVLRSSARRTCANFWSQPLDGAGTA